jgi:hypothetical protein
MITGPTSDPSYFEGEFIRFEMDHGHIGKTHVWSVTAKRDGLCLGYVHWFGRWRKYSFFPNDYTTYEQVCLRDIAEFLDIVMKMRKEGV